MNEQELKKLWDTKRGKKLVHPHNNGSKYGNCVTFDRLIGGTVFGRYETDRLCVEFLSVVANWQEYRTFEEQLEDL